jgi:segregation and condensation protein A
MDEDDLQKTPEACDEFSADAADAELDAALQQAETLAQPLAGEDAQAPEGAAASLADAAQASGDAGAYSDAQLDTAEDTAPAAHADFDAPDASDPGNDITMLVSLAAANRAAAMKIREAEMIAAQQKRHLGPGVVVPKDYVPSAESAHALYQLELDGFEGPLDLLLFLIKRHQLDIFDIPMGFICSQYLDTLAMMQQLNIDVAAEFLFMASELVHIKSRMLLPQDKDVAEDDDEADPRAALVARLLEYQTYKDAADQLQELPHLNRDVFARAPEALPASQADKKLREVSIYSLVQAFNAVLKRQKPEVRHKVVVETVSMRKRMLYLIDSLGDSEAVLFTKLLEGIEDRLDVIVTFLAVLEMTRLKLLRIYESEEGQLYLHPRFEKPEMAVSRIAGVDEHQYAG